MKKIIKWIAVPAGAIALVFLLRGFAFTSYLIPSEGMENSLFCGERILVNKWSYGLRLPLMSVLSYQRWGDGKPNSNDIVVFNNPANIRQAVIDRREVFISRCVAVPGDTILVDSLFTIHAARKACGPDQKRLYAYPKEKEQQLDSLLALLSIRDNEPMGQDSDQNIRSFSRYEFYLLEQTMNDGKWITPFKEDACDSLKPLVIPARGSVVRVQPWNRTLLINTLLLHEGKQVELRGDTLYVDGRATQHCYFTKDYYWMVANNSVNLADSRLFGLVPKDHIIGKASLVWFSKERGMGLLKGYRWNRFFRSVK